MGLTVPAPVLKQKDQVSETFFISEKVINLACGPVTFQDGTPLALERAKEFVFFVHRQNQGGMTEIWDEDTLEWKPESTSVKPSSLSYDENTGAWKAILAALGQKDKTQNDKFSTDPMIPYPKYFVHCYFRGTDGNGSEQEGMSPDSQLVEVYALGALNRAGIAIKPDSIREAEEVRLFLKDDTLAEKGIVVIRKVGIAFEIVLTTSNVSIVLTKEGDISLSPAMGRKTTIDRGLTVNGDLTVVGNASVNGDLAVQGQLSVSGSTSLTNGLSVQGNTTFSGNTTVSGNLAVVGVLSVNGVAVMVP